jgi:hypothetical protein
MSLRIFAVVYGFRGKINGGFKSVLCILLTVCYGTVPNTYLSRFDIACIMPDFQRY